MCVCVCVKSFVITKLDSVGGRMISFFHPLQNNIQNGPTLLILFVCFLILSWKWKELVFMGQNIRHFDIILSWRSRGDKIVIVSETGTLEMGFYYHSTSCVVSRIKLDFSKNG